MPIPTSFALAVCLAAPALAQPCDPVWEPLDGGTNHPVLALSPSHGSLFAGGSFTIAGEKECRRIARWDGAEWFPLGSGIGGEGDPRVHAVLGFGEGEHAAVFAAGAFSEAGNVGAHNIARWDGQHWSAVGGGLNEPAFCLVGFGEDHGGALVVGGNFTEAGDVAANRVARWDGEHWSALGHGLDGPVLALAVYDDGHGPALYAGGKFTHSGDHELNHIARWDGHDWLPVGGGVNEPVHALVSTHHFGDHPTLFAGGAFTEAGDLSVSRIARWNGQHWSDVGGGVGGVDHPVVAALSEFHDAHGPAIYAGGAFTLAGGHSAHHIARWDGEHWSGLGEGLGAPAHALAVYGVEDEHGPGLFAGGEFVKAGGEPANHIARWGCPPEGEPCYPDFNGDGELDLFDFLAFVNGFNDHSDHADCDLNGVLDLFDFLCFVNHFNAGC